MARDATKTIVEYGKVGDAHLDLVPALENCAPGLDPLEYNLIIAPAKMPEKVGSLFVPDQYKDSQELAMQVGRIVAQSPIAFNYDSWPAGTSPPKPGDIVWFARYAGGEFTGLDGERYRIIKDKDVGARIRTGATDDAGAQPRKKKGSKKGWDADYWEKPCIQCGLTRSDLCDAPPVPATCRLGHHFGEE